MKRCIDDDDEKYDVVASDKNIPHLKLSLTALPIHVADLTKHFALLPSLIVNASNRPHHADIPVRITAIKAVLIIQVYSCGKRLFR